jgi:hypothetical protein
MTNGCNIPGPSLHRAEAREEYIKLFLHDKRGIRTSESNRDYVTMLPLILKAAKKSNVTIPKV